jgi:hypothetical protein
MKIHHSYIIGIYNGPDRAALCASPRDMDQNDIYRECLIVCSNVDGRGLNFFDVRINKLAKVLVNVSELMISL